MLESIKNMLRPIPLSIDIKPILDKLYEDMMTLITEESVAGRWKQLGIAGKS